MSEAEAWREVARRYANGESGDAMWEAACNRDRAMFDDMVFRWERYGRDLPDTNEARCLAALWLALESEEDA